MVRIHKRASQLPIDITIAEWEIKKKGGANTLKISLLLYQFYKKKVQPCTYGQKEHLQITIQTPSRAFPPKHSSPNTKTAILLNPFSKIIYPFTGFLLFLIFLLGIAFSSLNKVTSPPLQPSFSIHSGFGYPCV